LVGTVEGRGHWFDPACKEMAEVNKNG